MNENLKLTELKKHHWVSPDSEKVFRCAGGKGGKDEVPVGRIARFTVWMMDEPIYDKSTQVGKITLRGCNRLSGRSCGLVGGLCVKEAVTDAAFNSDVALLEERTRESVKQALLRSI